MSGASTNQSDSSNGSGARPEVINGAEPEKRSELRRIGSWRPLGRRLAAAAVMLQGPETETAKPSSRILKPPGGGSSNLFGSPEEVSMSLRPHRMASNIFGEGEGSLNLPKRTNPPGGKDSGIFEEHKPNPSRQLTNPPGGKASNIFGSSPHASTVKAHPNKPKDHAVILNDKGDSLLGAKPEVKEDKKPQVEDVSGELQKENTKEPGHKIDNHEPRLGPRPRSHNKVLNPPGGKSSIVFY
uniref:Jupiter microtubule associated homolog 2 n=1 Tax=Pogona vitticeps TaxID=103695 RepID=A0A6J0VB82_9SAUR